MHHDTLQQGAGGAERLDLPSCLTAIQGALTDLLEARGVHSVPEAACPPDAQPLVRTVNRLLCQIEEIATLVVPLAAGELSAWRPSPDNLMAAPLLEMHERLSRLTRQTQAIAHGDYSQRVDFMGEFSEAFNSMVALLDEREQSLKAEIARRRQAEADLQRERDLLVSGPVITFRWGIDDDGTVEYVSPNISEFGFSAEEFTSGRRTYSSLIEPADYAWVVEDGNDKSRTGLDGWTQEYRLTDAAGATRWIRDFTHAVRGPDGEVTAYEGYIIDITAQKKTEHALRQREEQLRMLSLTDDLTGLYNRRGLLAVGEYLMRSVRRRGTGLGVVYVDVEGLKDINDRFGHSEGDKALRSLAGAIRGATRESDVTGRVGGDEFVILADDGPGITGDLLRRLERRLAALNTSSAHSFRLAVSGGAAEWDGDERVTLQQLIERADGHRHDAGRATQDPATDLSVQPRGRR